MIYRPFGNTAIQASVIGLGGHEFHPNGRVRGFSDDQKLAVTRGHVFDGFGQENRRAIVKKALDLGVNLFDLTIDSEKEAMGRILKDLKPSQEILIQTRPEGMVYGYNPQNRQMAQYGLLRTEVVRICGLIGRDHVDVLNFAFIKAALDADPDYLDKISSNIARLKREGLIRFASADTFSGEATYLRQYATGAFDSTFINYNIVEDYMDEAVIPDASRRGMAVLGRVAFQKGQIFAMAEEAGIADRALVARCSLKWILSNPRVASIVVGASTPAQIENACAVAAALGLTDEEHKVLDAVRETGSFKQAREKQRARFKV